MSAFLIFVISTFALGGCIFTTREAENPGQEETSWIVPDHPTKVFNNMQSGLESLSGTNYTKSLGIQFAFIPLPGDESQFPGFYAGWDRNREIDFVNNLIGDASSIKVDFINLAPITQDINFTQYEGRYNLRLVTKVSPDTNYYRGKARFDLREVSKGWELMKWEEIEADPNYPSLGFLKATL